MRAGEMIRGFGGKVLGWVVRAFRSLELEVA